MWYVGEAHCSTVGLLFFGRYACVRSVLWGEVPRTGPCLVWYGCCEVERYGWYIMVWWGRCGRYGTIPVRYPTGSMWAVSGGTVLHGTVKYTGNNVAVRLVFLFNRWGEAAVYVCDCKCCYCVSCFVGMLLVCMRCCMCD